MESLDTTQSLDYQLTLDLIQTEKLSGNVISGQYLVGNLVGCGQFGSVYDVSDLLCPGSKQYVIKISDDLQIMAKEIQAMRAFKKCHQENAHEVPEIRSYGIFVWNKRQG